MAKETAEVIFDINQTCPSCGARLAGALGEHRSFACGSILMKLPKGNTLNVGRMCLHIQIKQLTEKLMTSEDTICQVSAWFDNRCQHGRAAGFEKLAEILDRRK